MTKTYFNWSTGKDSALALYHAQKNENLDVNLLLTTVNSFHNRVSMHGLRRELLEKQIEAIGVPFQSIELPETPSMDEYANIMKSAVEQLKEKGYKNCIFGDIFLEDLRNYREQNLKGIKCHFPLWGRNTKELMSEFIDLGFRAITVCVNAQLLGEDFVGREINQSFIADLPSNVDVCGENGEFHTFCYDGPIFGKPVKFTKGEHIYREYPNPSQSEGEKIGFWFQDIF